MPLSQAPRSSTVCPADDQLIRQLLGESDLSPRLASHIGTCPNCSTRQAALIDRAAAFTSLRFPPLHWEAFRRFRMAHQPVHQVALDLGLSWREVWAISATVLHAVLSTLQSTDFLKEQLHPSEFQPAD
jgi:hypothetical protein